MSNTYNRRRLMGLCLYCETPPVFGMRTCENCRQKSNRRAEAYRRHGGAPVKYRKSPKLDRLIEQMDKVARLERQLSLMKRGAA